MKRVLRKSLIVVLAMMIILVLFVIISFVRHKICSSKEKDLRDSFGCACRSERPQYECIHRG